MDAAGFHGSSGSGVGKQVNDTGGIVEAATSVSPGHRNAKGLGTTTVSIVALFERDTTRH
jgi:hypothetical protein